MPYVDGFVLPIPKKNLKAYAKMAAQAGKVWIKHGALQYCECLGDDLNLSFGMSFLKGIKVKKGETIVFAWIVYKSKKDRDKINAKVMKDPELSQGMDVKKMPFDVKRMICGGFKTLVDL